MSDTASESREIRRASGILAGGTLVSRVLGLIRNQILSYFFGAGIEADAFIAAFTIPNALRRLFGEGGLTPAFVSLFTRSLDEGRSQWHSFLNNSFMWLNLIVGSLCILGMIFAEQLVSLYVPEYRDTPGKFELTVQLTRLLFPFILMISWAAFFMGVLNSFKHFTLPALGPAVLNATAIVLTPLFLLYIFPGTTKGIFIFAACILVGVFIQVLIQLPKLKAHEAMPHLHFKLRDKRVLELALLLGPAVFSMAIHQLNIIVNRVFASSIPGGVSYLFYADLIVELPVSLIATSMASAAVPSFSRLLSQDKKEELAESFQYSMNLNASLAMPAAVGLMALNLPIVSCLFFSGKFHLQDLDVTAQALFNYSLGLPLFCLMRSLFPLFFASKDTKTPAVAGMLALVVNFFGAWQLSKIHGAPGISLSTSIASSVNFLVLLFVAWKRFPFFPWGKIFFQIGKAVLAAAIMWLSIQGLGRVFDQGVWMNAGIRLDKIAILASYIFFGGAIYFLSAKILGLKEFTSILKYK